MDFEKKLSELEKIVQSMEEGSLSLEDSLKAFEKGIHISRQCQKELEEAEVKVEKLISMDEKSKAKTEPL